jgi:RNA polymerase sigma-70 factor (ECF subfamily)
VRLEPQITQQEQETQAGEDAAWLYATRSDPQAFAPLYDRYVNRIYTYCLRRVGKQDAEDLTSLVFARALAGVNSYHGGSVAAWLFRIAHNCVVSHYRARRTHAPIDETYPIADDSPQSLDQIILKDERRRVLAAVQTLPLDQQHLLWLKMAGGLTAQEIGEVLGKNAGAVRTELYRIIQRLRLRLSMEERTR